MNKLRFDSRGEYFIIDCDIYQFYGLRIRDFFSLWVLRESGRVVRAPITKNQYLDEPIKTVIPLLEKQGYQCTKTT